MFEGVIVHGGYCPDRLRRCPAVLTPVRDWFSEGKVAAAICHVSRVLVSAGILKGKKVTYVPAIRDDVVSAWATYVDREVVRDGNLITSRAPDELPAFCGEIIAALRGKQNPLR